jgi:hypothetical protein
MEFLELKQALNIHLTSMLKDNTTLFVTNVDKDKLWDIYLDSFPEGTNEIFRERREYDCSCCKQFIRSFGNVVIIKNNKLVSIWDFSCESYQLVIKALSKYVKSKFIKDVFVTQERIFGTDKSREQTENEEIHTWEHFYVKLPKVFVSNSNLSVPSLKGNFRDNKNVFKRSLEELTIDSVETVLEIIAQNSLYKGKEWESVLKEFYRLYKQYYKLKFSKRKDNYCWQQSVVAGGAIAKIRNHSIGTLLINLSEGMPLDIAVSKYEAIVAPTNYKRPKAIFTKKMIAQAKKTITKLGFLDSLKRRHAIIEDITINNVLFANRDVQQKITTDIFQDLEKKAINQKKFSKLEEVHIDHFIKDILPTTTNMEIFLENQHSPNFVSLIAPQNKESNIMFKWDNNFSWAYQGNITDSMKKRVKAAGGNVEGILRFSIQWNENKDNQNDFDAHCKEPDGNLIYFSNKGYRHPSTGMLDVDIIHPDITVAVENITWTNVDKMHEGEYVFLVHNYTHRGGRKGFSAEIEYDGQIYSYEYNEELKQDEKVIVAKIDFSKEKGITFKKSLPSDVSSKQIYNLNTNQFHEVSICMTSPNYWNEQKGIGHKHYFFMLKDCKNMEKPNGFFNEFLIEDLMKHKRVFEALGGEMRVGVSDNQLSGLGFSQTKRNSVICKLQGSFTRTIKLNF